MIKFKFPVPLPAVLLVASILLPIMVVLAVMVNQLFRIEKNLSMLMSNTVAVAPKVEVVASPTASPSGSPVVTPKPTKAPKTTPAPESGK